MQEARELLLRIIGDPKAKITEALRNDIVAYIQKPQYKLFRYDFKGETLGGEAVVIARTEIEARTTLMKSTNYPIRNLREAGRQDFIFLPHVVHFWNGDY